MSTELVPSCEAIIDRVCLALPSPNSRRAYTRALRDFFVWLEEKRLQGAAELNRETVLAYREYMVGRGLQNASINQALAALKKLAEEAMLDSLLPPMAERGISSIRLLPKQGSRLLRWLTVDQLKALLALPDRSTAWGRRDRVLLSLMGLAGLRREECTALQCTNVQYRDNRMVLEVAGKGNKTRVMATHALLQDAIEDWMITDNIFEGQLLRRIEKNGLPGDGLTRDGVRMVIDRYSERMGMKFTPHDLRRTAARLMRKGGAEIDRIKATLGHAAVSTTEHYIGQIMDLDSPACDMIQL